MKSETLQFPSSGGDPRPAFLDQPLGAPLSWVLLAHGATSTPTVADLSAALVARGLAVLRLEVGEDVPEAAEDILAAADFLRQSRTAPHLLAGYGTGGAAVLAAAGGIPEVQAVTVVASPAGKIEEVALADLGLPFLRLDSPRFAGEMLATWAALHVTPAAAPGVPPGMVLVGAQGHRLAQEVVAGHHWLTLDEPFSVPGGGDAGPNPYELLLAALGGCTSMTLRIFADREKIPLEGVRVRLRHSRIHAADCASCLSQEGRITRIEREIELDGPLDDEQRVLLLSIADRCPVHRTLTSEIDIQTRLA
jgi:putative redox protein